MCVCVWIIMTGDDEGSTDCQLLRRVGQKLCVIRLTDTGAIVQIGLNEPMDATRAALVCPMKPVPARVWFNTNDAKLLEECRLEIDWPACITSYMPPPVRFQRRARPGGSLSHPIQRTKRRRMGGD